MFDIFNTEAVLGAMVCGVLAAVIAKGLVLIRASRLARRRALVLAALKTNGPLVSTEVSAKTGLHLFHVYPMMRAMEADGLVSVIIDFSRVHLRGGRPRYIYRLTGTGERFLGEVACPS